MLLKLDFFILLAAQLEHADEILAQKRRIYDRYTNAFRRLTNDGLIRQQAMLPESQPNHHGFLLIVDSESTRQALIDHLARHEIAAVFHFTPLHESPMGQKLGYRQGQLPVTEDISRRVLRLPSYHEMSAEEIDRVVAAVYDFFSVPKPC